MGFILLQILYLSIDFEVQFVCSIKRMFGVSRV
jgi:hypothetical protein